MNDGAHYFSVVYFRYEFRVQSSEWRTAVILVLVVKKEAECETDRQTDRQTDPRADFNFNFSVMVTLDVCCVIS
jgi:hypothetical protein